MSHLYVCEFSNGHVKVGKSEDPPTRIGQHAERVACMGVYLTNNFAVECVGPSAPSESLLIETCAQVATKQHKNEWFEGLAFAQVCDWARHCADTVLPEITGGDTFGGTLRDLRCARFVSQRALGKAIGECGATVSFWENGRRVPNLNQIRGLCSFFDVSAAELLNGQPAQSPESR